MSSYVKVLFMSSVLFLTAACQDTLDTSSKLAKEHSVKQMMVGLYPQNQKIFKQALAAIYDADQGYHANLSNDEVMTLTDKRLEGKTVEEILHLSFLSKKRDQKKTVIDNEVGSTSTAVATNEVIEKKSMLVKIAFEKK